MKRSTFLGITLIIILIEIVYSIAHLNETKHFLGGVLQSKYYLLIAIAYTGFLFFTFWYFVFCVPTLSYKKDVKQHFIDLYGDKKYNYFYTYHFIAFAAFTFYDDAWPYFIMSVALFISWQWVRIKQNEYAENYEIERKKEEARYKPTVVLDRTDLL